jgi:hypothetical protein
MVRRQSSQKSLFLSLSLCFTIPRFCVLLIAINIGIIAAIVDIGAIWLTNIKSGICLPAFYLSREQCCVRLSITIFFID